MSNLGRAIYMAGSVFLFIVAATASIYLYGTLNAYLDISAPGVQIDNRAEVTVIDSSKKNREITRSEIYITVLNMEQMYVNKLILKTKNNDSYEVTLDDKGDLNSILRYLNEYPNINYTYDSDSALEGSTVTYTAQ